MNQEGDVRTVLRFALWPVCVDGKRVWLRFYRVEQVWREHYYRPMFEGWYLRRIL